MSSYKEITKESYEATAQEFARNVADLAPRESIERFAKLLPSQAKIIDIGCGSGRDAKLFSELGLNVLGIDICLNLLNLAKETAPLAQFQIMDIEEISLPANSFDGAWACCSLMHIPKEKMTSVLNRIHLILKEEGYFYLTIKEGLGEILENDLRYGEFSKFWSFFELEELRKTLEACNFKILELCSVEKSSDYHTHSCLKVFCQKRK